MAGTTRLELATSAVTALRELVLQQLTNTRGLPNAAQVAQGYRNCGLGCGLGICHPAALHIVRPVSSACAGEGPAPLRWEHWPTPGPCAAARSPTCPHAGTDRSRQRPTGTNRTTNWGAQGLEATQVRPRALATRQPLRPGS